ncbi:anthranilate synthase component I family protein [Fructobacillus americanaquae]|uniref:Anthranilate synthase component 1 n=1 Tax=Fructobacillus americanaquae TaxID=2940302 RepID=A0ABY5BZH9_9LACO|nr:anthranilate synthase component I family protein [Fructobacillus americanaquae]USS91752.1 anthranilate synthase component I family protein [Fructobacillus americanaquae]
MKQLDLKQYGQEYPFLPVIVSKRISNFDPELLMQELGTTKNQTMIFQREGVTTFFLSLEQTITGRDGQIQVMSADGAVETAQGDPIAFLNQLYHQYQIPKVTDAIPFVAGLMGYFAYDFVRYHPDVHLAPAQDDLGLADFELFLPKVVANYRHETKELILSQTVPSERLSTDFDQVQQKLNDLANRAGEMMDQIQENDLATAELENQVSSNQELLQGDEAKSQSALTFTNQLTRTAFSDRVQKTKEHIHAGDIFQLILSNPYLAKTNNQQLLLGVFTRLQGGPQSPYQFYFYNGDYQATGASPETLIKKTGDRLFSYPLAGTRRRGKTAEEDQFFAQELQHSEKELAEHNMLVDLGRNDLGRVSQFGTVAVTKLRHLLYFLNVMHLGSTIESQVQTDLTPIDILKATLPAGTLSGAPKISAMQIINQLENRKRGIYGGGIGTIGFDGDLDFSIGIRLAYQKKQNLVVQAGAGIVADSSPAEEYREFENKSRLMLDLVTKEAASDAITN